MCGIIGYVGNKQIVPLLINGLKHLEYRGYDSAGIALIHTDGQPTHVRSIGRVTSLEAACTDITLRKATTGIAHTRWATHGKPSEANAHPHRDCTGAIFVVHNGIVENYAELKEELMAEGHIFTSETDTEVLAHLIERAYAALPHNERTVLRATQNALLCVHGAYAIVVASTLDPEALIVARFSSPLVIGVGENEMTITSDIIAITSHTKNAIYLKDGDCARITANGYSIETLTYKQVVRTTEVITAHTAPADKKGHAHFMHKEIHEAPETLENALRGRLVPATSNVRLGGLDVVAEKLQSINAVRIIGCGTASYAALIGKYMIEDYANIPVEADTGSEFRYRNAIVPSNTAFIAISQSGETADTLASLREAKQQGALILGIVNTYGSSIARETEAGIYNHAGPEISVASTKAFISQLTVLALLGIHIGRMRGMSTERAHEAITALRNLPIDARKALQQEEVVRRIAEKYQHMEHSIVLGRNYSFPLALEAALKIKEVSYIHAEGFAAGEFKHGPIALVQEGTPCICIIPKDAVYEKMKSNIEELRARGGHIIAIATEGDDEISRLAKDVIYVPRTLPMLTPILMALPLYLLAYHLAILRGNDVDKPRNLAKSVTVE